MNDYPFWLRTAVSIVSGTHSGTLTLLRTSHATSARVGSQNRQYELFDFISNSYTDLMVLDYADPRP